MVTTWLGGLIAGFASLAAVIVVLTYLYTTPAYFPGVDAEFILRVATFVASAILVAFARTMQERTRREHERMLEAQKQARQAAERADEMKLKFLGMISHELRTPLTSIKGFTTTLLASDVKWDEASQRDFLNTIDEEADKLTELIDQLLDLSRIEAGSLRVNLRQTTLDSILSEADSQLRRLAARHDFNLVLPGCPLLVQADCQRMVQVLSNLVANAAKYSPPGTPITVALRCSGNEALVNVTDQGSGIAPEDLPHVFEAFQRGNDATTRRTQGTGLGLAICKGIIEAHSGRIWVQEAGAHGTTISFSLPTLPVTDVAAGGVPIAPLYCDREQR